MQKLLRKLGKKCQFICRDDKGNLIKKIRQEGFHARVILDSKRNKLKNHSDNYNLIHAKWLKTSWQVDAKETIKLLKNDKVDLLVIDHYGIDIKWEEKLRVKSNKIMVIDDLADRNHDCDILLDQNLVKNYKTRYKNFFYQKSVFLC